LRVSVKTCLKQIDENCEIPTIDKLPQETMRMPTSFENTPANLHAFVSVTVHGSKDITKVPLPTRFRKTTDPTTPTTSGSFYKYMSETLNVNVTAVYYPVRGDHAVRGGQGSSVLKRFVEDSGPTQYPFVGGMRLVLCLNGDELRDEELFLQSGAPCQGAGCCVM
jgi:hypothetical protein